jgi:fatty-acyl-CoA synthase
VTDRAHPAAETLHGALSEVSATNPRRLVFHLDEPVVVSSASLLERAGRRAGDLASLGIGAGDTVGLLGSNDPLWAEWAFAIWILGAVLIPLPYPLRVRDPDAAAEQLAVIVRAAGCRLVLSHPSVTSLLPPADQVRTMSWERPVGSGPPPAVPVPTVRAEDPAIIQFTSGSTSAPKGAVLTHRAVLAAVRSMQQAYAIDGTRDRFLAWLPLFHDNGLIGYLIRPLLLGAEAHIIPTQRFASDPLLWLELVEATGATITSGPSSAWAVVVRAAERSDRSFDLSSLRYAILAAELVDPEVADRLARVGGRFGLSPSAVGAAYGLAEATLTVSVTPRGGGLRIDRIDPLAMSTGGRAVPSSEATAKRVASSGRPMPGVSMRIVGPGGALAERHVGEIEVRAPSVMEGYLGGQGDPFHDGWLRTGDVGYIAEGEVFVTGRSKDILIVAGRNFAPEDIEWAAQRAAGVRAGRCVAFGGGSDLDGEIVVAVEPNDASNLNQLPGRVRLAVFDAIEVMPRTVLVLPPDSIPKTTSGKLRRHALQQAYAAGRLQTLA